MVKSAEVETVPSGLDFENVPSPWEAYFLPGTAVLKNKAGIKDEAALEQFEQEASALRLAAMRLRSVTGKFDLDHIQSIHRELFQDVYEWAGEIREVNISKGGTTFERLDRVHTIAANLARSLASENFLRGLPKNAFVERLTDYYTGWNALHPFREGNGRTTLEFIRQMARNAGYDFDRKKIDQAPGRWYNAAKDGFHENPVPLRNIFSESVRPLVAVDVERLSLNRAAMIHPELMPLAIKAQALEAQFEAAYKNTPNKAGFLMEKVHVELVRQLDSGKPVSALPLPSRTEPMQAVSHGLKL